jgi:hypothetical protein
MTIALIVRTRNTSLLDASFLQQKPHKLDISQRIALGEDN